MGLVPPETLQRPVPGRTAADLRQEGWILRMRQKDRRSECDAVHTKCSDLVHTKCSDLVHTKCSDLVNSAEQPTGGEWKE